MVRSAADAPSRAEGSGDRMRIGLVSAFTSVSLLAIASAATAQPAAPAPTAATVAEESTLGELVVTARRRSESLQEVPQVVNVVTADSLQKLNIQRFQDISAVVPGLTLTATTNGYQT